MSGVDVIIEDLSKHPKCIHGPTLLFSRDIDGKTRYFYACSACRDRKKCSFFVWKDELERYVNKKIPKQIEEHLKGINHRKLFLKLNEVKANCSERRIYCHTCCLLTSKEELEKHKEHDVTENITDHLLEHPTEILKPLEDPKKEAQYLFSKKCVEHLVSILKNSGFKNIICIGTPRIFEHIQNDFDLNAILLDFDSRFHSFFGPLQFCWYNIFNNHFFKEEGRKVFEDFLNTSGDSDTIVISDPPFGGRIEPIADTLNKIRSKFMQHHKSCKQLPIFWIFPYFMESHIKNRMNNFHMLDYKVDYDNHPLFQSGDKGRKYGSPVRIFTNLAPSSITLFPEEGYKYCSKCEKWVSSENKHCKKCNECTSKDGRTYNHCDSCKRCVKPSWIHCDECKKCAQKDHSCDKITFNKACFHCKEEGHKKRDCPKVNHEELSKKRKLGLKTKRNVKKCIAH